MRRAPRARAAVVLLAVALPVLAGCRSAPDVAAYVGDAEITVAQVERAVDDRLADEQIATFAEASPGDYTRRVLGGLVERQVHAVAAERYGVQVTDAEVARRIEQLLGGDDPDAVYDQLAQQGIARADVRETIREQLLRRELAAAEGDAAALDESALRARYEQVREGLAEVSLGYITVPDQATADAVLAQLTTTPASYPAVAARYPGPTTLPALETRSPDEVPTPLAEGVGAAAPGTGFTTSVPDIDGVVVTFVEGIVYPTFEEVRPQLEEEVAGQVDAAGAALVDVVREDLDVTVNPRFGVLQDGQVVPGEGGVVDLLDGGSEPQGPDAPAGGPAG